MEDRLLFLLKNIDIILKLNIDTMFYLKYGFVLKFYLLENYSFLLLNI
ncbi:hypothetical protein JMUB3934_1649 [Leptotrichia wadei]|uniref:Uncharacterized protein n=1 Tax=Leptotrichia wadei TaxID=157687 RepID=A0A510KF84_9FUSO|nr:hypothetical protein JMUB3934_1649 [Leptotrichia wadei]